MSSGEEFVMKCLTTEINSFDYNHWQDLRSKSAGSLDISVNYIVHDEYQDHFSLNTKDSGQYHLNFTNITFALSGMYQVQAKRGSASKKRAAKLLIIG